MSEPRPVQLNPSGPPDTILDAEPAEARDALRAALATEPDQRRDAVAAVVVRWPRYLDAWARLGDLGRDPIERYAAYRVGYHRGLDRLRANGWRGSGLVRWRHETNRGFLAALAGLAAEAGSIDEHDEAERCELFLRQLDPDWPPSSLERG
jgi:hypothetical protein